MTGADPNTGVKVDSPAAAELRALTPVAGPSTFKPFFFGLTNLFAAVLLGGPGGILIWIGLTEGKDGDRAPMYWLGGAFVFLGILFLCASIRRFRAAGDKAIGIQVGPTGIALGVPTNPWFGWFRLQFITRQYTVRWNEIAKWYPYLRTVNGIPTESALIFELTQGGRITANTMFYDASRSALVSKIEAAMNGSGQG